MLRITAARKKYGSTVATYVIYSLKLQSLRIEDCHHLTCLLSWLPLIQNCNTQHYCLCCFYFSKAWCQRKYLWLKLECCQTELFAGKDRLVKIGFCIHVLLFLSLMLWIILFCFFSSFEYINHTNVAVEELWILRHERILIGLDCIVVCRLWWRYLLLQFSLDSMSMVGMADSWIGRYEWVW